MRTSQGWELIKFNKYHRSLPALAVLGMERSGWVVRVWRILWLGWSPWPADPAELGTAGLKAMGVNTGTALTPVGTAAPWPAQPRLS